MLRASSVLPRGAPRDNFAHRRLVAHVARERRRLEEAAAALVAAYRGIARARELLPAYQQPTAGDFTTLDHAALAVLAEIAEARGDLARLEALERFAGLEPW
jgi:hypothetical protein